MAFKFERLEVWQIAVELSSEIGRLTESFPKKELYILTPQIMRAADSIALNIAEGSTGQTDPEFKKFLGYAIRSGIEVISCLYVGRKRKIIDEVDFARLYSAYEGLIIKIQALRSRFKGEYFLADALSTISQR